VKTADRKFYCSKIILKEYRRLSGERRVRKLELCHYYHHHHHLEEVDLFRRLTSRKAPLGAGIAQWYSSGLQTG
jgi:hypothetical protein